MNMQVSMRPMVFIGRSKAEALDQPEPGGIGHHRQRSMALSRRSALSTKAGRPETPGRKSDHHRERQPDGETGEAPLVRVATAPCSMTSLKTTSRRARHRSGRRAARAGGRPRREPQETAGPARSACPPAAVKLGPHLVLGRASGGLSSRCQSSIRVSSRSSSPRGRNTGSSPCQAASRRRQNRRPRRRQGRSWRQKAIVQLGAGGRPRGAIPGGARPAPRSVCRGSPSPSRARGPRSSKRKMRSKALVLRSSLSMMKVRVPACMNTPSSARKKTSILLTSKQDGAIGVARMRLRASRK